MIPEDRLSFYAHIRPLQKAVHASRNPLAPRQVVETILVSWLKVDYPYLNRAALSSVKKFAELPSVGTFIGWLRDRPLAEGAFWLASAYSKLVNEYHRRELAMFFTPPDLAMRVVSNLVRNGARLTSDKFVDPACGGAAFLAPLAVKIRASMARDGSSSTKILRHLERHLVGRDLDPVLCRLSVFFLRMFLYKDIVSAKFEPRFDIHTGNALRCFKRRYGRFNVVICNPPYRKMTSAEVTCVGSSYNEILGGQPNLYSLFFALALRLVRPCGVTAMLTPTSYLSGQSFAKLRAHVLSKAEAVQLDIIDDRNGVFVGVEQETAVAILRRKTQSESGLGATTIFVASREGTFKRAGRCILPISGTVWAIPRSIEDAATLKAVNGSKHSLVDYGYAPRVGAFVWNRDPRKRFSNWQDARRKALAPYPLIWSSHIGQDGRFVDQPKQAKARQFRFVDVGNVRQRPIVSGPCVALQRVTSNDQRKRLVAAAVPQSLVARCGGIVGENHVVFLEQINGHARLTPKQLVRMLRSPTIDQLFRCISGAVNVSVFELLRLPLPDPSVFPPLLRQGISPEKAVRLAFEAGRLRRRGRTRECAS